MRKIGFIPAYKFRWYVYACFTSVRLKLFIIIICTLHKKCHRGIGIENLEVLVGLFANINVEFFLNTVMKRTQRLLQKRLEKFSH